MTQPWLQKLNYMARSGPDAFHIVLYYITLINGVVLARLFAASTVNNWLQISGGWGFEA